MLHYELCLDALKQTGLDADWQTVYIGWLGFPGAWEWETMRLPVRDIQQFALDCLPSGDAETDYLLVRVIDAEPSEKGLQSEEATLRQLADACGISATMGRRKWQYALLRQLADKMTATPPPDDPADFYDRYLNSQYKYERQADVIARILPDVNLPEFTGKTVSEDAAILREWLLCHKGAYAAK